MRAILNESEIDMRVQYMIEVMFHVRKDNFAAFPAVIDELDLVEEEDQITHMITLDDAQDPENMLNVFRFDPEWEKNEEMYEEIKKEILGDDDDEDDDDEAENGEETSHFKANFHYFFKFIVKQFSSNFKFFFKPKPRSIYISNFILFIYFPKPLLLFISNLHFFKMRRLKRKQLLIKRRQI